MKKIIILLLIACFTVTSFAQKKKQTPVMKAVSSASYAKADNLVAEIKSANFQLTIMENGKQKEAIIVKPIDTKFTPMNTKITPFTANGVKLYLLSWTEETITTTSLSTEKATIIYSNIYDITNKKAVYTNKQTTIHISEKVFLDANKTASETQQKVRREGYEFILHSDGTISQKSKKSEVKLSYDVGKKEFIIN
jgi:hypothetical protein